ncbi:ddb1 and cul4 associated factor 7 [Allomyces javanicus]|nr:ddb1 and cul4 associated factor 7 [Allomyces javanicus]KAJ3358657.1 ddb1 and cul4 associated factor 7 [Allomyces javanicus]
MHAPNPFLAGAGAGALPSDLDAMHVDASEIAMPFPTYAMAWTAAHDRPGLLALGSFVSANSAPGGAWASRAPSRSGAAGSAASGTTAQAAPDRLCIVEHDGGARIASVAEVALPYPATRVQWAPAAAASTRVLATAGDYLRLWKLHDHGDPAALDGDGGPHLSMEALLANQAKADLVAPLTGFDWNAAAPHLVVTCSIDTTCTVWDVNSSQAKTQLIAHDRDVFDVGFAPGTADIFASVGADGSVRLFDLRALEHSTIIYEHPQSAPLLRLAWNRQDPNYLAVLAYESHTITVLDVRRPSLAVAELAGHTTCVNAAHWLPHNSGYLVSAGDDGQVLVWDVAQPTRPPAAPSSGGGTAPAPTYAPVLSHVPHPMGAEVENLAVSPVTDWVAVSCDTQVKLLRL